MAGTRGHVEFRLDPLALQFVKYKVRLSSARIEHMDPLLTEEKAKAYLSQNTAPPLVRLGSHSAPPPPSAASAVAISPALAAACSLSRTFSSLLSSPRCSSSRSDRSSSLSYSAGS
eukprot:6294583-Prymnesium_polylepis.1